MKKRDIEAHRAQFTRYVRKMEERSASDPNNTSTRRMLFNGLTWLGTTEMQAGNLVEARVHFRRALALVEALVEAFEVAALGRVIAQNRVADTLERLATVALRTGDLEVARAHLERALEIRAAVVAAKADKPAPKRNLSATLKLLGTAETRSGALETARAHYERALSVLTPVAADLRAEFTLVELRLDLVELAALARDPRARREHLEAARDVIEALYDRGRVKGLREREAARARIQRELAALES